MLQYNGELIKHNINTRWYQLSICAEMWINEAHCMHTHMQPFLICMHACTHTPTLSFPCACILGVVCTQEILHKTHAHKHTVLCQCCPSQWQSAAGQLRRSNNWALHTLTCQSCFLPVCRCCQTINLSLFHMLPLSTLSSTPLTIPLLYLFLIYCILSCTVLPQFPMF